MSCVASMTNHSLSSSWVMRATSLSTGSSTSHWLGLQCPEGAQGGVGQLFTQDLGVDRTFPPYKDCSIELRDHADPAPKGQQPYIDIGLFCSAFPHIPMDTLHSQDLGGEGSPPFALFTRVLLHTVSITLASHSELLAR